jgi:hypothetical protein
LRNISDARFSTFKIAFAKSPGGERSRGAMKNVDQPNACTTVIETDVFDDFISTKVTLEWHVN